ncbi:MAG: VOC family protein [Proteobacteria bacterium]|nr:MAG: VOC family protein [Pseudomonadota bacterium]
MLRNFNSSAIVAVSDIRRSKDFYANTLGLELEDGYDGLLKFTTGHTSLVVYESEYAGTNKANAVVWGASAPRLLLPTPVEDNNA